MIAMLKKLIKLGLPFKIRQESVYDLKRENSSFDMILFLEVIEHLEFASKAVKELFRVTGKHVVISVPNEPVWRISNVLRGKYVMHAGNTPGHVNHYSEKSLSSLIHPFGQIISVIKPCPWLMVLAKKT
jgi:2-polyprenyl-3-methyl-5-hydroxy-6-metoxy-1,4-benzoquinol methylase